MAIQRGPIHWRRTITWLSLNRVTRTPLVPCHLTLSTIESTAGVMLWSWVPCPLPYFMGFTSNSLMIVCLTGPDRYGAVILGFFILGSRFRSVPRFLAIKRPR